MSECDVLKDVDALWVGTTTKTLRSLWLFCFFSSGGFLFSRERERERERECNIL